MPKLIIESDNRNTLEIDENQFVLDQILDQNLSYPHGCRAGSCGACSTIVSEGDDGLNSPSAVEADTISRIAHTLSGADQKSIQEGAVLRLCCRIRASKDLTIRPTT